VQASRSFATQSHFQEGATLARAGPKHSRGLILSTRAREYQIGSFDVNRFDDQHWHWCRLSSMSNQFSAAARKLVLLFVGTATIRRRRLDQEGRPDGRSVALRISKSDPRSSITLGALNAADAAQDVLPSALSVARRPAFRASPRRESNS
jgi:hypothetical protein